MTSLQKIVRDNFILKEVSKRLKAKENSGGVEEKHNKKYCKPTELVRLMIFLLMVREGY